MKNITVSVPDEVHRAARIRAAERGTSVSALVTEYLRTLAADGETGPDRRELLGALDEVARALGGAVVASERRPGADSGS